MKKSTVLNKKRAQQSPKRRPQLSYAERTAISDDRMFKTALSLIKEHGVFNTTLREIGERAGYSRGLASNRFGSKEHFFFKLVDQIHNERESMFVIGLGHNRGLEALLTNLDSTIDFLTRDSDYIRSMYLLSYETIGSNAILRKRLADHHNKHRKSLHRWLGEAIEDGDIRSDTEIFDISIEHIALYYGIVYLWLSDTNCIEFKSVLSKYRSRLIGQISVIT